MDDEAAETPAETEKKPKDKKDKEKKEKKDKKEKKEAEDGKKRSKEKDGEKPKKEKKEKKEDVIEHVDIPRASIDNVSADLDLDIQSPYNSVQEETRRSIGSANELHSGGEQIAIDAFMQEAEVAEEADVAEGFAPQVQIDETVGDGQDTVDDATAEQDGDNGHDAEATDALRSKEDKKSNKDKSKKVKKDKKDKKEKKEDETRDLDVQRPSIDNFSADQDLDIQAPVDSIQEDTRRPASSAQASDLRSGGEADAFMQEAEGAVGDGQHQHHAREEQEGGTGEEGKKSKKDKSKKAKKEKKEKKEKHIDESENVLQSGGEEEPLMQEEIPLPEGVDIMDLEAIALRGPIKLGAGDDINIPERVNQTPKRFTLTGKEMVRKCTRCDLLWDGTAIVCPHCRSSLSDSILQVSELLSPSQRDFLKQAFRRYDVDSSGRLDGKELRMAVRELGWDTKQDVLDRWARLGGLQGLSLAEFENLVASGKLGKKTFKSSKGTASQAVQDEERQMLQMAAGANLQLSTAGRQGRRMGLIPGQDEPVLEALASVPASSTIPFGEGESVFAELPAHRKIELTEAWSFWDADHSGFLEPLELLSATKGLGFHFPIEMIISVCGKHGGGIDQENFVRVMSVQIKQRDQELGLWDASAVDFGADLEEDDHEPSTLAQKWKKELAKAELNLRRTSPTDKVFQWRSLLCTSHATVGEYSVAIRLYFDLVLLLVIAFGVLTFMTLPLLLICGSSSGGGPVLQQTDEVISTLARFSVGNLNRSPAADATVHIMNEFIGSMALLCALLLFRFVIVKRATYKTNPQNISNLAVQVRALPKDLGYHHSGYEELIREHFQTVAYERAVRMGTAEELDDQPVREVVMWRNYEGAVYGVMNQVELQAKQHSINTELKFLEQKASEYRLSDELEHDVGYTAGGSLAPTSGRRQSTKGRQTMNLMKERQSAAVTGTSSVHEEGADFSTAVTAMAEKMYDRICNRADGGKRLAKRQNHLLAQNDLIEEQILQIETDRALHADLKPQEREVMGAFVVFWCERTRDAVMGQYGWSRSWWCRACCQPRRLRLKLPFEESSDNSEGPPDEEEIAFPLIVEPTQDPSLQLWQNMDVKPVVRTVRSCIMGLCRLVVFTVVFLVACFTGTTHVYYPILLPMEATVWVITNMTDIVVNVNASNGEVCWRVCELELFSDSSCQTRLDPYMFVSSNGLPTGDDAGLRFAQDRVFAGGSVCMHDWRPATCWAPLNLSALCGEPGNCPASASSGARRVEEVVQQERQEELHEEESFEETMEQPRQLSSTACPWITEGSYNVSQVTYTIRYQSLYGSFKGSTNTKPELISALQTAFEEVPEVLAETSSLRKVYVFEGNPVGMPPDVSQVSHDCGDDPDAATKLKEWLGISGPDVQALSSCQDFARMGLLGVPFCSNLPKVYRCLCATTCRCPCQNSTCDCEEPPDGVSLLPLNKSGSVFTYEAEISVCSKDGNQLKKMTCDFVDLFDATQPVETAAEAANTLIEQLRNEGILPITIFAGPPLDKSCNTALSCAVGEVYCYNRFNEPVCATRCNGFEECFHAIDEIGCRPCGNGSCDVPVGRCVDAVSGASACLECSSAAWNLSQPEQDLCQILDITGGQGSLAWQQCKESLCEHLGDGCNPTLPDFDPCRCLEARPSLEQREAFGCLVRGNWSAALRPALGLMALHHFDAVKAKKLEDEMELITLECTTLGEEGNESSGGCAATSYDRIEGPALLFTGLDWLQNEEEVATPAAQAWHLWVKTTCSSCAVAHLFGGAYLMVDENGHLATLSPTGGLWQPAGCAALNDDIFHFVGFSFGPDEGEQIFQDGATCGQRTIEVANSSGWSSAAAKSLVMFGGNTTSLSIFSGEMDAAAIFATEMTVQDLRHDMIAATWRGEGPTFAQRYLASACEDSRLANSNFPRCGLEVEQILAETWPCVQGDMCGCFAKLKGKRELQCSIGCAGSNLRRTLPKLLEERCSDELHLGKSCQTDGDCDSLFPPIGQEAKLVCDSDTFKCTFGTTFVLPQHLLEGSLCIARGRSSPPLERWQAQYLLAALTKNNASIFLTVETTDGCDLVDANVSTDFVTAHDGSTAFDRQAADFKTTVTETTTAMASLNETTTETSTGASTSEQATTSTAETTMDELLFEGKLEVSLDLPNVVVFGAGGVQQLRFKVNASADSTGLEGLLAVAEKIQGSLGSYVSQDPSPDLAHTDMKEEVPATLSKVIKDGSRVLNVSHIVLGTPLVSVTYQEPELCSSAEFECAPGVCALCPSDSCLCDGWQDCENGGDEDIWGLLVQRNVTTAECELLRNRSLTNTSVNENGTVEGDDPCFGVSGFPCNGTVCIPIPQHCDGIEDCPDGADEEGCPAMPESLDNETNVSFQWIAAVFFADQEVQCVRLSQPDGVVAPQVRVLSCDLEAILPGKLDLAKANGKHVPSPMRNPPANCRYMASIVTDTARVGQDNPPFVKADVDHVQGQAVFSSKQCAVGPKLQNYEIIGLATAELAYERDPGSTIVMCYCIQRMFLEPAVMLELDAEDKVAIMCSNFTDMAEGNYHRSWIRVGVIVVFNELFEATIRHTSTTVRYKDETTRLVRHFKNLFWFWLLNAAVMPALVSCTIPAAWGWLNRELELSTVPHGGMSMREWHGWVGSVITLSMACRVFIPQVPDLIAVCCRRCNRYRKARKMISQEDLKNLYVNPEFRIAEGFAEVTVTASIAMIFGPALPLLNVLAAVSCFTRYLVDWYIFLRHSRRPAMYDEIIARVSVNHLLMALVFRSATSILVWVDPTLFASDVEGCSFDETDVDSLRAQYFQENFRMFELFVNPTCNPGAWFFAFLPGLSAVGCLVVLPNLTIVRSILMVLCRRCRSKTGYLYDDVVKARLHRRIVASYQPRVHPGFQTAFKLMDLTANFNEQGLSDSSESHASTDLASEPEPEEENLAVTIFGKEYEDMEYFKRLKKEKKREKKEKKEKKKKESTDPFDDPDVNPYDLGAQEKHHKKRKKDKKDKKGDQNYSEAQALSGLVDF